MAEYVSLPGIPESITRKEYLGLIEQIGFDIDGDNVATHRVCIRVVNEEQESEDPG